LLVLSPEVSTPGLEDFAKQAEPILRLMGRLDFVGKRVLDIGCRDGFFSFHAERRGAADLVGIDTCLSLGAVELIIPHFQSKVRMIELSLYELNAAEHGVFDIVLFCGVLYHLRYPFIALKTLADLVPHGGRMILSVCFYLAIKDFSIKFQRSNGCAAPAKLTGPTQTGFAVFVTKSSILL
jgi:2-polyprenyl-3-methyl-5-hydroxy-6-metoxy-1,4-benzoquinol methylase